MTLNLSFLVKRLLNEVHVIDEGNVLYFLSSEILDGAQNIFLLSRLDGGGNILPHATVNVCDLVGMRRVQQEILTSNA
jgi:hypothetical protein